MKRKIVVIDGKEIFLNAVKSAGIEIPKTEKEFHKLLDDVDSNLKKMRKRN